MYTRFVALMNKTTLWDTNFDSSRNHGLRENHIHPVGYWASRPKLLGYDPGQYKPTRLGVPAGATPSRPSKGCR